MPQFENLDALIEGIHFETVDIPEYPHMPKTDLDLEAASKDPDGLPEEWRVYFATIESWKTQTTRVSEQIRLGTVLRLRDGRTVVIGNINPNLGMCSCCEMDIDDVVAFGQLFHASPAVT